MEIITGYTGTPHITAAQDRAENQGTFGTGSYVLNVGSKLAATAISANEVQIADGVLSHQGCLAIIENGSYDSLPIANGSQGMNRIDLIVARYTKGSGTNVESMSLVVIQGTATSSTPSAPSYNTGDIQNGDTPVDMPLYQVSLTGISLTSITPVFTAVQTQSETDTLLGNTSISGIGNGTVTGALSTLNSNISGLATTVQYGTAAQNVTGAFSYIKIGRVVVFSGTLSLSASFAAGNTIISAIPSSLVANVLFYSNNNNAVNSRYALLAAGTNLNAGETIPSGVSLRVAGAYLSAS